MSVESVAAVSDQKHTRRSMRAFHTALSSLVVLQTKVRGYGASKRGTRKTHHIHALT